MGMVKKKREKIILFCFVFGYKRRQHENIAKHPNKGGRKRGKERGKEKLKRPQEWRKKKERRRRK
ncbi:MAG: hypothetical protein ACRDRV_11115, partial [Pseudonocardiaceae bacterium]